MLKRILIFTIVVAVGAAGLAGYEIYNERTSAAVEASTLKSLSADEVGLMIKHQIDAGDGAAKAMAESPEARKAFLKGLGEYLAIAAAARRDGMAENKTFQINLEYKKNLLLTDMYEAKLNPGGVQASAIPDAEMQSVWSSPNEEAFKRDMDTMMSIQEAVAAKTNGVRPGVLQGESLERARTKWARVKVLSDRAKADQEFITRQDVQLRLRILEAGILSADYLRENWEAKIKATDAEIAAYLAEHPEYDLIKKRKRALQVLERVKQGEDLAKLATEFSEHRPTKQNGGLFEKVTAGTMPPVLEASVLSLEEGTFADSLIETALGYHIVMLVDKSETKGADGRRSIEYTFRQILFQNKFQQPNVTDPNVPPPFMTAEEIARSSVETEKRSRLIDELTAQAGITLPDDFTIPAS